MTLRKIAFALGVLLHDIVGEDDQSLLDYARQNNLTFSEYSELLKLSADDSARYTADEWQEEHRQLQLDRFPTLAKFAEEQRLTWNDIAMLMRHAGDTPPRTADEWQELYRWTKAFTQTM